MDFIVVPLYGREIAAVGGDMREFERQAAPVGR